jgi:L-2,4-diaminobutyrate decarboxylase
MTELLKKAYSSDSFRQDGHVLVDIIADYLAQAQNQTLTTVIPYQKPNDALHYWQNDLEKAAIDDPSTLFKDIIDHSTHLHHPKYMGHQVAVTAPLATLTGLLTQILNNGMAVYEMGMVSNPQERILMDLFAQRIGFDISKSNGTITSGGTLANLTTLLTARALNAPTDVWSEGSSQRLAIMVSEEAHYCIDRAARIMGLGTEGIVKIPCDGAFKMRTELLETYYNEAIDKGFYVFAIIGSACSTSTGSHDDLEAIATFAKEKNLWFHVDAAHGGAAIFSKKYRSLLRGIEKADSVIIDLHKMMMIPALATAVIYKNGQDSFRTFHQKAQYLFATEDEDWYNSGKRTFECTKAMYITKFYVMLKTYSEAIFEEYVDYLYDLGQKMADILRKKDEFELAHNPETNIVCFRYKPKKSADLSRLNTLIRQKLLEKGNFYIVQTAIKSNIFLRVSLMNPFTTEGDIIALLDEIEKIGISLMQLD